MCCGDRSEFVPQNWVTYDNRDDKNEKPLKAEWHIVVVSARKTNNVNVLIRAIAAIAGDNPGYIAYTLVDTSPVSSVKFSQWIKSMRGDYVALPGETNVPRAFNVGVNRNRRTKYTLVLHDDVVIPEGRDWLDTLNLGIKRVAGVTVPHLTGECSNRIQSLENYGAVCHTNEYISSAAMAFNTEELLREGFNDLLSGYDWWQIDYQVRMARKGRAVLVAPCTLHHIGGQTYKYSSSDTSIGFTNNLLLLKEDIGFENDFKRRPRLPRICLTHPDSETGKGLAAIVSCPCHINKAYDLMQSEGFSQLAIIDALHDDKTEEELNFFERHNITYHPIVEDPFLQGVNAVDYKHVAVVDFREGSEMSRVEGKRIRCGTHYRLHSQITDLNIGMMAHYALGDTLMMTPAIHAFKKVAPWVNIRVHHGWDAGKLLENNSDINSIVAYDMKQIAPPIDLIDIGTRNGTEETILAAFDELGLERPSGLAHLRYTVTEDERIDAVNWLSSHGIDVKRSDSYVVGLQKHGGWKAKKWAHYGALISRLSLVGASIIAFSSDPSRLEGMADAEQGHDIIYVDQEPLRRVFAIISLLDGICTFDSGLGYCAAALDIPCVSLWGPHDPSKMMAIAGANQICIRKRTPNQCEKERGTSCRRMSGGSVCPFRANGLGADCLDEILPEEVMEHLASSPRWNIAVESRKH